MAKAGERPSGPAKPDVTVSVKIALRGVKPSVWRRVLVPDALSLGDLHIVIQAAMGWDNSHLHAFEIDGRQYGERGMLEGGADEERMRLRALLKSGVKTFAYTYDFGDDWEHTVTLEKTLPAVAGEVYPRCVAGKRACPPEDCGGRWGYEQMLEVLADPTHPDYQEQREQVGDAFDPDSFDVVATNAAMMARLGLA